MTFPYIICILCLKISEVTCYILNLLYFFYGFFICKFLRSFFLPLGSITTTTTTPSLQPTCLFNIATYLTFHRASALISHISLIIPFLGDTPPQTRERGPTNQPATHSLPLIEFMFLIAFRRLLLLLLLSAA